MLKKNFKYLRSLSFAAALSVTQFSQFSYAQYITGPIAGALGGAGRGASDDGEQVFMNPAAIVHGSQFTSSFIFTEGYAAADEYLNQFAVGLTDNSKGLLLSGGYTYVRSKKKFPIFSNVTEDYHQFAVAKSVIDHVSIGATASYLLSKVKGQEEYDQWDISIGTLYNPNPDFGIGGVIYNIASRDKDIPREVQNLDKIAIGAHYIFMPMFRVRFDVSEQLVYNSDGKKDYQLGIESKINYFIVSRIGFEKDELSDRDFYTLGLAFDGPRLKIDYSYRKNVDSSDGAMHGVDLRLPFW